MDISNKAYFFIYVGNNIINSVNILLDLFLIRKSMFIMFLLNLGVDNNMEFGDKVKMLRKNHDLSQESLATILKINRNCLSRIETGKSEPSLSVIRDIAEYFKVDVTSLMDVNVEKLGTKDKIKRIMEGCQYLMDNDLDFLVRVISVMREEYVKHEDNE